MTGRPSSYTDAIAEEICDRLINGESMRSICRDEHMPDRATILRWLDANEEFAARYARARTMQADFMDDLILDTANATTSETAAADRVKIAAYQWRASKLAPKKYGERTTQTIEGGDKPLEVREVSQTEIARRLAAILTDATKD